MKLQMVTKIRVMRAAQKRTRVLRLKVVATMSAKMLRTPPRLRLRRTSRYPLTEAGKKIRPRRSVSKKSTTRESLLRSAWSLISQLL